MRKSPGMRPPPAPGPLKVGIVDIIARKPSRSLYARLMYPNFASIMPQVVGVWAEELGCRVHYVTYTGFEDLDRELPDDIDVLFISAFTPAAYLAYSISNLYRKRGVVTVLGGPHARAYSEDALKYFDYVTGFTDKDLIRDLLKGFSRHEGRGVRLSAGRQPRTLPGIRERWRFIRATLDKTWLLATVPTIGSLGCPYTCSFCIDSRIDYQTLPYEEIREDLRFLRTQPRRPIVAWHDPNFAVRFDDYMGIMEEAVPPGSLQFIAESSLSLLGESHLKRLARNGAGAIIVGIESWFDFNNKAKQGGRTGIDKVKAVAEQVNLISRYVPYVQTNLVWGLDQDAGPEPFELTKRFLDLAPAPFPSHSLFGAYGDSSPLAVRLQREGRITDVPFQFLDTSSLHNVALKNYSPGEFYRRMSDIVRYSYSPRANWRRFQRNRDRLFSGGRWVTLVRSTSSGWRAGYYAKLQALCEGDRQFGAFLSGETLAAPAGLRRKVKADLGKFHDHLPSEIARYLEGHDSGNSALVGSEEYLESNPG